VTNPATGAVIAEVADLGVEETKRAIAAPTRPGRRGAQTGKERAATCANGSTWLSPPRTTLPGDDL